IGYSEAPVISNVHRDPEFISPNGDGVQDTLLVSYSVASPTTAEFRIVSASGAVVRHFTRVHTTAGDSSFTLDGRDDSGLAVPDGGYAVQFGSIVLPVTVDTVPPTVLLKHTEASLLLYTTPPPIRRTEQTVELREPRPSRPAPHLGWQIQQGPTNALVAV